MSSSSSGDSSFHSHVPVPNQSDYQLNYGSSTSRAAQKRQTARKSTARSHGAPEQRSTTQRPQLRKRRTPMQLSQRLLKEICHLQASTTFLIPKICFGRLVREIIHSFSGEINCITREAMQALQESTEMYVTQQLQDAYLLSMHANRVTLMVKDMEVLRLLRYRN